LKLLRELVPKRRLSYGESLRIAELQANRMLEAFGIAGPRVADELITELPRMEVRVEHGVPVSGSAHWENNRWIITLNADEPYVRRRFSLAHEFKHIIDHTTKQYLYGNADRDEGAEDRAERAADAFAAALLMPKRWIKARWYESGQNLVVLADRIGVSTRALSVRLYYLGISQATPRCPSPNRPRSDMRRYYLRYTPQPLGAVR
jgi:Zn-dependent peptidase ImmA (M78 family)